MRSLDSIANRLSQKQARLRLRIFLCVFVSSIALESCLCVSS